MLCTHKKDGELVAAQPRNGVRFAQARTQAAGHDLQKLIAGVVPEGVVDAFKIIEVEEQDGGFLAAPHARQGHFNAILQQNAVGESRQRIVVGEECQTFFNAARFGDVFLSCHPTAVWERAVPNRYRAAVVEMVEFVGLGFDGHQPFGHVLFRRLARVNAVGDATLDNFAKRHSGTDVTGFKPVDAGERIVAKNDAAVSIVHAQSKRHIVYGGVELSAAAGQFFCEVVASLDLLVQPAL